jgi:hypothetical protein
MFFVFDSDVEDHQRIVGHSEFLSVDFGDKSFNQSNSGL